MKSCPIMMAIAPAVPPRTTLPISRCFVSPDTSHLSRDPGAVIVGARRTHLQGLSGSSWPAKAGLWGTK